MVGRRLGSGVDLLVILVGILKVEAVAVSYDRVCMAATPAKLPLPHDAMFLVGSILEDGDLTHQKHTEARHLEIHQMNHIGTP
jgi:hypothetical protein